MTQVLTGIQDSGDAGQASADRLFELVYPELRRLAGSYMAGERAGHTLQPTAVVNEAYLRLADLSRMKWQGRTHFFAVGARVMRRLLIDHARGHASQKRGGEWRRVTLSGTGGSDDRGLEPEELLELDRALGKLQALDERQARVVELRYFGGLTVAEVAEALGVSRRTVEGDWTHARAWLRRELG